MAKKTAKLVYDTMAAFAAVVSSNGKYPSKKAAKAAAKAAGNTSKAQAQADNAKKVTAYGSSWISGLTISRVNSVGSHDLSVEIRFKCSIPGWQVKDLELDIEQYSTATNTWSQMGNNTVKLDQSSYANGYYTYLFDAPNEVDISMLRVAVLAHPNSRDVTAHYYVATKKTSGSGKNKKTWYVVDKKSEKQSKDYFSASWSKFETLSPAPALADSQDDAKKLAVEAPEKPAPPTAELLSNGTVKVSFEPIDRETADRCRIVYRCEDGAYDIEGSNISNMLDTPGQTYFVDDRVSPGHEYRYYVRAYNDRTAEGKPDAPPSLPADLCAPLKTAPVEVEMLSAVGYGSNGAKVSFVYPSWAYFPALEEASVYYADDLDTLVTNQKSCSSASVTLGMGVMSVIVTGLDAGKVWYFAPWLKTGSDELQERFCDSVAMCAIAATPDPPTILTSATAANVGSTFTLEWAHNCSDGSAQEDAVITATISKKDGTVSVKEYDGIGTSDAYDIELDPEDFPDLSTASFTVKTKGASNEWSDQSEALAISVYATTSAMLTVENATSDGGLVPVVGSLPLTLGLSVTAATGTLSQSVIQWRVVVSAVDAFTYTNVYGNEARVAPMETVADVEVDGNDDGFSQPAYTMVIPAKDAIFANGVTYRATVSALMDSGLEAEPFSADFKCSFEGGLGIPSAYIVPDFDWSARVYPSLVEEREVADGDDYVIDLDCIRLAESTRGSYELAISYRDDEGDKSLRLDWDGSESELPVGEMGEWLSVSSVPADGGTGPVELSGASYNFKKPVDDVLISVYRINPDGSMSELCEGLPNGVGVFCVDRHPSFGTMSYRIVANSQLTDEVTACDVTGENNWSGILIQWDEVDVPPVGDGMEAGEYAYSFEWVLLPWNVQVRQSSAKDVAYKKYQGRKHPVALYGTQVGETGSWSCSIVKNVEDLELSQLRRLASWMGGCWVRDTSGLSYPANVDVSIDWSYNTVEIPVSLEVTRSDD